MIRIGQLGLPILMLAVFAAAQVQFVSEALAQPASEAVLRNKPQVIIAFSPDIPPYVTHKATQGLQVDIVRDALSQETLHVVQLPYKQLQTAIQEKQADVTVCVQPINKGVLYSNDFITFQNYAISKKADDLKINRISDLKGHRVLAWQDAYLELGSEFKQLFSPESQQRKNYVEVADQKEQVRMFWEGKCDIVVIDINIFRYFSREMGHSMAEVSLHTLFPAITSFKVGFRDAAMRDAFDRGLEEMCKSGRYAKLLSRYHVTLESTVCDEAAVRDAVAGFYSALNALFDGNVAPMKEVWSHAADVTYMGPDGGFQVGWDQVLANWEKQAARKLGGKITPAEMRITIGQDIAITHNYEQGANTNAESGKPAKVSIRVTNLFRKENGRWKMIGHHTDQLPFLKN
jgi:polar amino acid transport system substrate-binding protein